MICPNLYMIVAATAKERGIGYKNAMLFHAPEDLRYYKATTLGHTIIMGYNTYLSLPRRPLPGRTNVVLSRQNRDLPEEVVLMHSLDEVLQHVENHPDKTFFICGGANIYRQFMPYCSKLYLTWFLDCPENQVEESLIDASFPPIQKEEWIKTTEFAEEENLKSAHPHVFALYHRKGPIAK